MPTANNPKIQKHKNFSYRIKNNSSLPYSIEIVGFIHEGIEWEVARVLHSTPGWHPGESEETEVVRQLIICIVSNSDDEKRIAVVSSMKIGKDKWSSNLVDEKLFETSAEGLKAYDKEMGKMPLGLSGKIIHPSKNIPNDEKERIKNLKKWREENKEEEK